MNCEDRRESIFLGEGERELFLKNLEEPCANTDGQVHAWRLMSNHFHLVIEPPKANSVAGMNGLEVDCPKPDNGGRAVSRQLRATKQQ